MIHKDWKCYVFALKIGFRSMFCGHYLIGLKQLLFPISYWRFPIFNIVLDNIAHDNQHQILDIGSPKLLSLYLAVQSGQAVYATDLQDADIFNRYYAYYLDLEGHADDRYVVEFQDARALTYPDEYFDVAYSLSVFEHIPGEGDKEAIHEIRRVLKTGGKAIIEVPFAEAANDEYLSHDIYDRRYSGAPVFYQRHYDKYTLVTRLIDESKMHLEGIYITKEKLPFERYWSRLHKFIRVPFLWLEAFVSAFNHVICKYESNETMRRVKYDGRGMNATIILKKDSRKAE